MTTRTIFGSVAACLVSGLLLLATSYRAQATDYFWTGAAPGDNSWNNGQNWHLVEFGFPGNDDTATIDGFFNVYVDAPFAGFPNALTIAGGSNLYTGPTFFADGYELVFDNETGGPLAKTLITGTNSSLIVTKNLSGAHLDAFDTDLLTVENGGTVWMEGSVLEVDRGKLDINTGGTVRGYGSIDLEAPLGSPGVVLENDGLLRVTGGAFGSPVGGTLDIDVTSANGRIDLDGTSGNGQVIISWQSTLDIDAELNDAYSDLMTLSADSKLIMRKDWSADVNSTIEVNAETATAGVPDIVTIAGGILRTTGDVNVNSGTLVFEAILIAESTARVHVAANSTVQFDSAAIFSDGSQLDLNAANTTLVVSGNPIASTAIFGGTFNWDGPGTLANVTTVRAFADLQISVDEIDVGNNIYNGTINNSGEIDVRLTDPLDNWTMAGTLNLDAFTGGNLFTGYMIVTGEVNVFDGGIPAVAGSGGPAAAGAPGTAMISGDIIEFGSTSLLNINGGIAGIMPIDRAVFRPGSTVNVAAGATVALEDTVDFEPGANVNLAATAHLRVVSGTTTVDTNLDFNGSTVTIDENATLNLHDLNNNVFNATLNMAPGSGLNFLTVQGDFTLPGALYLDSGAGNISILLPTQATFGGKVNVSGTGTTTIAGQSIELLDDFNVNAGATAILSADLVSYSDLPDIRVGNGATLTLNVNQIDDGNGNNGLGTSTHIDGGLMEIKITNSDPYFMSGTTNLIGSLGDANPPTLRTDHMVVTGKLRGNCFCDIELLVIDGHHFVGFSAGATHVTGDYEQTANGVYEAEIGGLLLGVDYDNITVDGTAMLGGELNLALINSFAPTLGNSFEILSAAGGVLGEFDSVTFNMSGGAYLGGGLALDVIYNPTDVTVDVISVLLGDFDVDGDVDGFDFLKWQRGETPGSYSALDYNDWQTNLGATGGPAIAAAAIPEPSTCLLMACAMITVLPLRTKWRFDRARPNSPTARTRGPRASSDGFFIVLQTNANNQ